MASVVRLISALITLAACAAAPLAWEAARPRPPKVLHPVLDSGLRDLLPPGRSPFLIHEPGGRVHARVRTSRPDILRREARRLAFEVRAVLGEVASVVVAPAALPALARLEGVRSIKPARAYRPLLDVSTMDVGALLAASSFDATGRNVIVAILDSGIDFRHADFRNPDGSSRILAIWDQTTPGGGAGCGPAAGFGKCWTKADLDTNLAGMGGPISFQDGFGHGSHVAGIAAGNGLASDPAAGVPDGTYAGVAPQADLLIVKVITDGGAVVGDLVAALAWVDDRATLEGKPAVVNLSLGSDLGAHDGTDPDEIALDAFLAPGIPGRAAAIASGNSRSNGIHTEGVVAPAGVVSHPFSIPGYTPLGGSSNDFIFIDLWADGVAGNPADVDLAAAITDAAGAPLASTLSGTSSGLVCTPMGGIVIDATNAPDPDNGSTEVFITISDTSSCPGAPPPPAGATLKVRVTSLAAAQDIGYHIWSEALLGAFSAHIRFTPAVESTLVDVPATSQHAAATGGYVTRQCWPNADPNSTGTTCFGISAPIGGLMGFSSGGPTRDGRMKPEVVSPGEWVASAATSALTLPLVRLTPDRMHWTLRGTSMAAPHLTGALALLFEKDPSLDAVQARSLVVDGARADSFTGAVPSDLFGAGKLGVSGALGALFKLVSGVRFDDAGTMLWDPEPHSLAYNIYRGDLPGALPASYGGCIAAGIPIESHDDAASPPPEAAFFYQITGVKDGIEGRFGFDAAGQERANGTPCP